MKNLSAIVITLISCLSLKAATLDDFAGNYGLLADNSAPAGSPCSKTLTVRVPKVSPPRIEMSGENEALNIFENVNEGTKCTPDKNECESVTLNQSTLVDITTSYYSTSGVRRIDVQAKDVFILSEDGTYLTEVMDEWESLGQNPETNLFIDCIWKRK